MATTRPLTGLLNYGRPSLPRPAAFGKTTYALNCVRNAAQGLQFAPRVVVPSHLQVRAWCRRRAEAGGALGVRELDQLWEMVVGESG